MQEKNLRLALLCGALFAAFTQTSFAAEPAAAPAGHEIRRAGDTPSAKGSDKWFVGNVRQDSIAEGLGSCWIHRAREEFESPEGKALLEKLGVKGDYVGIGHAILGVPAAAPGEAPAHREGRVFRI